jgi:hypothetical protein
MLEAIMVVTMMSGQEITTKMPNFTECLQQVKAVEQQKSVKEVACIPKGTNIDNSAKFWTFFDKVSELMELQRNFCTNNPLHSSCEPHVPIER